MNEKNEKQQDEPDVVENASTSADATTQDYQAEYLEWWKSRWGMMDII